MKSWKNKIKIIFLMVLCSIVISSCGRQSGKVEDAKIDYGASDIYSKSDMDDAIDQIKEEFEGWEGCELHNISYAGDESIDDESVEWMNELAVGSGLEANFSQCIQFVSDFHSPVNESDAGTFNPDEEYTNWSWWLARTDNGEWNLMTWGY